MEFQLKVQVRLKCDFYRIYMIHADIQGKTGVPEDILTSCCLGMLRLLPDDYLIELLALACHRDGRMLNLIGFDAVDELEFWPWLRDGGEPDAIATLSSNSTSRRAKIVIEVKHGAGKSSGNEDQLARYFKSAALQYNNYEVYLIYLTHHRDMPIGDLEASLTCLTSDAHIYWLNWFTVAKWSTYKLYLTQPSLVESRILFSINNYLSLKGYRRFEQLNAIPWEVVSSPAYTKDYFETDNPLKSYFEITYNRSYKNKQKLSSVKCIYKPST